MAPANPNTARIPIWSPGTFTALDGRSYQFSADDLAATAQAYLPATFAAPWVKGHPANDDPALGWAQALEWDGQILWAQSDRIDPAFAQEVRAGRYARISPRFFLPDDPSNPVPGTYYLRHIGWLGAATPANKGLPSPQFADPAGQVSFADGPEVPAPGHILGDPPATDSTPDDPRQEPPMADPNQTATGDDQQAAFAEQQAHLDQRQADIEAREQRLTEQEAERHRAGCAAFADGLVNEGRILPADASFVTALLAGIADDAQVAFADGDNQVTAATGERLRDFLARLPVQVDFAERTAPGEETETGASFAAPAGYTVDPSRAELHSKAVAYQKAHPGTEYAAAVAAVS